MRTAWALQGIGYLILLLFVYFAVQKNISPVTLEKTYDNATTMNNNVQFLIHSPAFQHEQRIPEKYTCDGDNISPPLAIENIPSRTASMVLIVDDPDASQGTWDHWIVFNIPRDVTRIPENIKSLGMEGNTSWGTMGFGGPCPPNGNHRYYFRLFALDTTLRLKQGSSKAEILESMKGHIIAESILMGTYVRN
jgi:Raf kinase inhibitor-like YbhB/YbcL family protein